MKKVNMKITDFENLMSYYRSVMLLMVIGYNLDFPELEKFKRYSWDTPTNRAAFARFMDEELIPGMLRVAKQVPLKNIQDDFAHLGDLMREAIDQLAITEGDGH